MPERRHRLIALAVLVIAGTAAWLIHRRDRTLAGSSSERAQSADTSAAHRAEDAPPGVAILRSYATPETDAPSDLRLVHRALENFALLVKGGDPLPLGSNDEIAAALRGKNKARLVFLPPGHPAFNDQGQIIDRWGAPLFFHANSRDRIDIRSAGPDRQMWTADDIHQRKDGAIFTGGELPAGR